MELGRAASHVDASGFVAEVAAVVFRVAFEGERNATARFTLELLRVTRRL